MLKKVLALTLSILLVAAGVSSALTLGDVIQAVKNSELSAPALPENTLTSRPDESVYMVLKLGDTGNFLSWVVSDDNVKPFLPLIEAQKNSEDIKGWLEMAKMFASTTPIKSAAVIFGMTKEPFFQAAFTVKDEYSSVVERISDGTASDVDFVKLLLGEGNPFVPIASTMTKAKKLADNVYEVDTGVFVKAQGGTILVCETLDEVKSMSGDGEKLFAKASRKFSDEDFVYVHADYGVLSELDDEKKLAKAVKYFDKPLNVEVSFKAEPEKFRISGFVNFYETIRKEFLKEVTKIPAVAGSYIRPTGSGTPLLMFGGQLRLSALKTQDETKDLWTALMKLAKVFGLSEDDVLSFVDGAFSLTVNDSVNFEIMKVPAVYISQTGKSGVAGAIFEKLSSSKLFHKVQEGVLQLDTSVSPVSCLVNTDGDTLGVSFAEVSSITSKPEIKPLLSELMKSAGVSALWLDFEAARSWVMSDENGVFAMLLPMSKMMGFSEIVETARDVLSAEFSVPSMWWMAEDIETFKIEFSRAKINPDNGLATKLVKLYLKYKK